MFSKNGHNILVGFLALITGAIISYIACQHSFFDIKTEFNVVELLLSVATIGIGIYIALIFEKNKNKSQNFYTYVEGKYDLLWEDFIQFSEVLELSPNIELAETAKWFKKINKKLTPLIKVFNSFEYDSAHLTNIESKIDELDDYLSNNEHTQNQVIDLSQNQDLLVKNLNDINELFAKSFKELSKI